MSPLLQLEVVGIQAPALALGEEGEQVRSAADVRRYVTNRLTKSPPWLLEAVQRLAERDRPLGRRVVCRCCGYLTLAEYGA